MYRKISYLVPVVIVLHLFLHSASAIPPEWTSRDIGTTGGQAFENNGRWKVTGDGDDIWGYADAFHYAYIPLSGDGEIIARVLDNGTGSDIWAKGGVMIRETLNPNSKFAMMIATGGEGEGKAFQCRPTTDGRCYSAHGGWEIYPPFWIKLERKGDTFTAFFSYDGVDWMQQSDGTEEDAMTNPNIIHMARDVYVGLCVTSHADGELRTFTFDNVYIGGFPLTAFEPYPLDGALHPDSWATLLWDAGTTATSHDVYFGDNLVDVQAGTKSTFQGNQLLTYFDVGLPGSPYPDGLMPGMTYYWRIDEVELNGWTNVGNVWSFTIISQTPFESFPHDGAEIRDSTPLLQWNSNEAVVQYDVYFGTDFNSVEEANRLDTSGIYRGWWTEANYATEELDPGRTYYWRIDEIMNDRTIHEGPVWSFTVIDTITIECQVCSSEDDGYASNEDLRNIDRDYMKIGACVFEQPPYYLCGMVFRNVDVPQGAEIISAYLKIRSYNSHLTDLVYARIEAEAVDNAESFGSSHHMDSLPRTQVSVDWDHYEPWIENTWYNSPNIADVIQEVVNRNGWSPMNGSLAILYSTREREGGYRNISAYDRNSDDAPKLEITYAH